MLKVLPKKRRIRMLQDGGVLLATETNGTSESKTNGTATKDKPEPRPEQKPQVNEPLAEQTNGHFKYYTVQPGDWLSKIARRFYGYPFKACRFHRLHHSQFYKESSEFSYYVASEDCVGSQPDETFLKGFEKI